MRVSPEIMAKFARKVINYSVEGPYLHAGIHENKAAVKEAIDTFEKGLALGKGLLHSNASDFSTTLTFVQDSTTGNTLIKGSRVKKLLPFNLREKISPRDTRVDTEILAKTLKEAYTADIQAKAAAQRVKAAEKALTAKNAKARPRPPQLQEPTPIKLTSTPNAKINAMRLAAATKKANSKPLEDVLGGAPIHTKLRLVATEAKDPFTKEITYNYKFVPPERRNPYSCLRLFSWGE